MEKESSLAHPLIAELRHQGHTAKQIADRLGLTKSAVQGRLQRLGVRADRKRPRKIDEARLSELVRSGMTHKLAAETLGVSISCVERRCKTLDLETARTGPRAGEGHTGWKSGRVVDKYGYILIYVPMHPYARAIGRVSEHRLLMEVVLGRYLLAGEVVDHIDGNPYHNWPDNLRLFASNADHLRKELTGRLKSTPRKSIPGAYGSNQTIDQCPEETETLALCPSETRQRLARHILIHRPTTAHRNLSHRAYLRSGALEAPFPPPSTG